MVILATKHVEYHVFADAFGVSLATIGRYREGMSLPQPYARITVRDWLVSTLKAKSLQLAAV
jgi:hypothetical protein